MKKTILALLCQLLVVQTILPYQAVPAIWLLVLPFMTTSITSQPMDETILGSPLFIGLSVGLIALASVRLYYESKIEDLHCADKFEELYAVMMSALIDRAVLATNAPQVALDYHEMRELGSQFEMNSEGMEKKVKRVGEII